MPSWSGCIASQTTSLKGGTSTSEVVINAAVPAKWFSNGVMALRCTEGVSGSIFCDVYGAVGGATFLIGGVSTITGAGNTIIPTDGVQANTASATYPTTSGQQGFPRPSLVIFGTAGAVGVGYTASVYLAGEYC